jgi:hypothetical protein
MTGKFIKLLLVAPLLVGCIDKEKRRAEFMERCAAAKFEHEQCIFLLAIVEKANSDAAADAAVANGAMAAALAAQAQK